MESLAEDKQTELLERVIDHIESGAEPELRELVAELHPAENADLLESLPPEERTALWEAIPSQQEGEILAYLGEEARASIIDEMDHSELLAAAEAMDVEDLAEVLEELPRDLSDSIVQALEEDHRRRLEAVLSYEEDTAGRLMSADVLSVRPDVTLAVVLRWLRRRKGLPPHTDTLMVTDPEGHFVGAITLSEVITGDPDTTVESVMHPDAATVQANDSERAVVSLFERRDLISVAVLNEEGVLLGRITVDDVVDVIREEADRVLLQSAGLEEEEDLFAPVLPSARRRSVWLGINLITVFVAAWVIGQFEDALDKIVALAVLMPVVASMGGIAGSQTLTLTIRGLALDQIASSNLRWLTLKEIAVGALNGVLWALVVALVAYLWFQSSGIAAVIAAAMILNLLAAAASGVVIPLVLDRFGIDPALSGAVILTTVTDVVGFLSFLGLATLFLL